MGLPVYKIVIRDHDESGVDFIALVDHPAIDLTFQTFQVQKSKFQANQEKRIISGPAMVAGLPIYRKDKDKGEYYVVFEKDTIESICRKFFRNGFTSNVNLMHDPKRLAEGVYLFESFLIDSERGIKTPAGYDELPDGSWFVSMKVDNDTVWNDFIKTGEFRGFSVEGFFGEELQNEDEDETLIQTVIDSILK
jgi:hypothetical protein